ncbi:DUF4139 domain-containing protein [Aurantiacibacter sediminis]|uniref:DUF4139 domain-containing protein n=1 Tax=Aurantiacibacter sediminis TaxID=2793064 RepID=A0ABS0N2U5_9SPHN|nr:hypothetical protein [Aurantiacibacter sediminis]MBH5322283.1 hypothetical protein [Aurantiacibacter sediminis]
MEASAPQDLAVTVYRDPNRVPWRQMNRNNPRGFAMISETRTVTLPPGESTIRFDGVSEGMVAVSAIVTGLPGGTIEKNRNADLLSPAALVDGTLGNRVTITRTNPATGEAESEDAIVRTRADGGLVLQTDEGYEAVRCSGLREGLSFDEIPGGLSPNPVFTIDTASEAGGTYTVTLSYLSWGFDWQANYVAALQEEGDADDVRFDLSSWLTILNDNGQSFENAELMAVAGSLNIVSNFSQLASPPRARPLQLTCWPRGSTATGIPVPNYDFNESEYDDAIVVTGARVQRESMTSPSPVQALAPPPPPPPPVVAGEENLGDLKLYRIPVRMDVNAQGLKQVLFLQEEDVEGELVYEITCTPWSSRVEPYPVQLSLETVNDEEHGLGVALPSGEVSIFEQSAFGELWVRDVNLRDFASGQDVEMPIGESNQVFGNCTSLGDQTQQGWNTRWAGMTLELTNANPEAVRVRVQMGSPLQWEIRGQRAGVRDAQRFVEIRVPANGARTVEWETRVPQPDEEES